MLHTHSFTYHPRYIMFLSQYLAFPCQYHSTNTPYSAEYYSYGKHKRAKPGLLYFSGFRRHNVDPSHFEHCFETSGTSRPMTRRHITGPLWQPVTLILSGFEKVQLSGCLIFQDAHETTERSKKLIFIACKVSAATITSNPAGCIDRLQVSVSESS